MTVFHQRVRAALWLATGIALAIFLIVPVEIAFRLEMQGEARSGLHILSLAASLVAVFAATSLMYRKVAGLVAALILACMALIRMVYAGLVQFSGHGFTDEVFIHMQPESFRVAWLEYPERLIGIGIGVLVMLILFFALATRIRRPGTWLAIGLLLIAMPVFWLSRAGSPEWMLASAAHRWYSPKPTALAPEQLARWQASDLYRLDLIPKQQVEARAPDRPRNLILLYIESGGLVLADHPSWPGLMPNLQGMLAEHGFVDYLHASSFITIEGIVNSQCGTLFPFEKGGESLAGTGGMAENLPCLGDVLAQAGYQQTYLGGAGLGLAGKGHFLRAHGFDKVVGQEEWAEQGLAQRPETWGVSDADLFDRSLDEVRALRAAAQPFNLTLLTIGTHLPGYAYAECSAYARSSDRFLNALHCTDQLIGKWVRRLQSEGLLDNTLLVITADHHIFPNPDMVRLFGEQAVADRRLPLIVMGDTGGHEPATRVGAGYDLAPTLLELLDIQHTARFALGRSMLQGEAVRDYLPTRYADIYQGQTVRAKGKPCSGAPPQPDALEFPLDRCNKSQLLTLVRATNETFSLPPPRASCDSGVALGVNLPDAPDDEISILLGDQQQASRFSWKKQGISRATQGLFLVFLDANGVLVERRYSPTELAAKEFSQVPEHAKAQVLLAVWRPGEPGSASPPKWLRDWSGSSTAGAWLFALPSGELIAGSDQPQTAAGTAQQLQLERPQCLATFGSGLRAAIARHLGI